MADIIKKYGNSSINEFWGFVERLGFSPAAADAEATRLDLLKQLSPTTSEKYKLICDDLAYDLFNRIGDKSVQGLLYAAYDAIALGRDHYKLCVQRPETLVSQNNQAHALNHLGNVFPTEDDYYTKLVSAQETGYHIDDYDNL